MMDNTQIHSIEDWDKILEALALYFSNKHDFIVTKDNIFDGLFMTTADRFNIEWAGNLIDENISYDEALELLSFFDFKTLSQYAYTENNIMPAGSLMAYKARVKDNGLIWLIHKYDKDPFPSSPHAHQLDNNFKLDLSNSKCYKVRKHTHTISRKNLLNFRAKAEEVFDGNLPALEV